MRMILICNRFPGWLENARGDDLMTALLRRAHDQLVDAAPIDASPLTDDLLLIRYLFGLSGDSLINEAVESGKSPYRSPLFYG